MNRTKAVNWTNSFRHVNLDPFHRDYFPTRCKRIGHYLRAGELFKDESAYASASENFALLPSFWHGMSPVERRVVVTVTETNNNEMSVACMNTLHQECKFPYSQMGDLRVILIISRIHPES